MTKQSVTHSVNSHNVKLYKFNVKAIPCPEPQRVEGSEIIAEYNITTLGAIVTYQCHENFKLYLDGHVLNNTRMFNKTCELDTGMLTAKWSRNCTCLGKWGASSQIESKYYAHSVSFI